MLIIISSTCPTSRTRGSTVAHPRSPPCCRTTTTLRTGTCRTTIGPRSRERPSRPRSRANSVLQTESRRPSGFSIAPTVSVFRTLIAAVQLDSGDLTGVLARYRDLPVVRAVRQPLYWAADPIKRLGARGDYLSDPAWLRGFEQVADAGLVWDLLVYDEQLPATHELIAAFPDTTFVLEAAGWPVDLTAEGFTRWRNASRR